MHSKIKPLDELVRLRREWAGLRKTVVWTNGCFDLIHAGHVRNLRDAKALGDILVVGLNGDASVRSIKGPGRPLIPEQDRAELIAAFEVVDHVTIFPEPDPIHALSLLRPDVHCKGADYADSPLPERDTVLGYGGTIHFLPFHPGLSTTNLISRIARLANEGRA